MTLVLARLRVRTRRRKPRPPWWWLAVVCCLATAAVIAWCVEGVLTGSPGDLFMIVCNALSFRYWWTYVVADTEEKPPNPHFPLGAFWSLWFTGMVVNLIAGAFA